MNTAFRKLNELENSSHLQYSRKKKTLPVIAQSEMNCDTLEETYTRILIPSMNTSQVNPPRDKKKVVQSTIELPGSLVQLIKGISSLTPPNNTLDLEFDDESKVSMSSKELDIKQRSMDILEHFEEDSFAEAFASNFHLCFRIKVMKIGSHK